mmetsp:Transcript_18811/g.43240  ORF Transcript_18811/g.43240 Transcript_18811/m.43240 type:complete len:268 (-) Transcript_18811:45-848(-)
MVFVGLYLQRKANLAFLMDIERAYERRCQRTGCARPSKCLSDYTDQDCMRFFRFNKEEIRRLIQCFRLTDASQDGSNHTLIPCSRNDSTGWWRVRSDTAMLIFLYRMAHCPDLHSVRTFFGNMPVSKCSSVFNYVLKHIYDGWSIRVTSLQFWSEHVEDIATQLSLAGSPYCNLIGLVDGTVQIISRPGGRKNSRNTLDQEEVYNGHIRKHTLNFMEIALSNGFLLINGPYQGRRHDAAMFTDCQLLRDLQAIQQSTGTRYIVYGDR